MNLYQTVHTLIVMVASHPLWYFAHQMEQQESKRPRIVMEVREQDLGEVTDTNSKQTVEFTFSNTGNADLVITDVSTACGCTNVDFPDKPVKPGKKGKIMVTYDGKTQPKGPFRKSIVVYSNDSRKYTRIFVKGNRTL